MAHPAGRTLPLTALLSRASFLLQLHTRKPTTVERRAPGMSAAEVELSLALHQRSSRALRVIPFAARGDRLRSAIASINEHGTLLSTPILAGVLDESTGGVICTRSTAEEVRRHLKGLTPRLVEAEVPPSRVLAFDDSAHRPLLSSALNTWLKWLLQRHGGYRALAPHGALLVDTYDLIDGPHETLGPLDPVMALASSEFELRAGTCTAATMAGTCTPATMSLDVFAEDMESTRPNSAEDSFDFHGLLKLHLQGRGVRRGTSSFVPLSLLCPDARAVFAATGSVDLGSREFYRKYDVESENGVRAIGRCLPQLEAVRILSMHIDPPPDLEGEGHIDADGHRSAWGERTGIWIPHERLSPFAVVVDSHGYRATVPANLLWPDATVTVLRPSPHNLQALAAVSQPALERLVELVRAHAPLAGMQLSFHALPSTCASTAFGVKPGAVPPPKPLLALPPVSSAPRPTVHASPKPPGRPAWAMKRVGESPVASGAPHKRPTASPTPTLLPDPKRPRVHGASTASKGSKPAPSGPPNAPSCAKPSARPATINGSTAEFQSMTLPVLKEKCKQLGLRVGGTKGAPLALASVPAFPWHCKLA